MPATSIQECPVCRSGVADRVNSDLLSGYSVEEVARHIVGNHLTEPQIRRHFENGHLRSSPAIQLKILAEMAQEERRLEEFLMNSKENLVLQRPNKTRLKRFERLNMNWDRRAYLEAEKALTAIRNRRLQIYREQAKVSPEVQSEISRATGLISDDHAARVMGDLMQRMLEDPTQRALLERKMGLEPAVEVRSEKIEGEGEE